MYIKVILAPRTSHVQSGHRPFLCIKAAGKSLGTCGWAWQKKKQVVRENTNYRKILVWEKGRDVPLTHWNGSQCIGYIWTSVLIGLRHYRVWEGKKREDPEACNFVTQKADIYQVLHCCSLSQNLIFFYIFPLAF